MKILVIGIRKEHARKLEKMFPQISFDFLDSSINNYKGRLKSGVDRFDKILNLVKFAGTSMVNTLRHHPGYVSIGGSMSSLIKVLEGMVA